MPRSTLKSLFNSGISTLSSGWKPYSRLILSGDNAGWSLDWDIRELRNISRQLGIQTMPSIWSASKTPQAVFLASQFFLFDDEWLTTPHRIGLSLFHGLPNSGDKTFDAIFSGLCRNHERISRIQVSHSQMREVVTKSGIDPSKIHLIPIGINLSLFHYRDEIRRVKERLRLNIPDNAFVIGSFQKDGNGWGEGLEPKLIKGPDIFIKTMDLVKSSIPELFVLLTGPARGYVKAGLDQLQIPYRHIFLKDYPDIGRIFPTLDLYLVASRQEGGPKAIFESMASGVPLVTTRVGQAMDIVKHGENGWITDIEDVEGLANWVKYVHQNKGNQLLPIIKNGRVTAEANAYSKQLHLWKKFMEGFVEWEN